MTNLLRKHNEYLKPDFLNMNRHQETSVFLYSLTRLILLLLHFQNPGLNEISKENLRLGFTLV